MKNMNVFFMLLVFINSACSGMSLNDEHHFNLRIENIGQRPQHKVKIKNVDENFIIPGLSRMILRPGIGATFLKIPFHVPEWVEVIWESEDGVIVNKKVQIRSRLPKDFQGTIVLVRSKYS